jgi:hypothetical protein
MRANNHEPLLAQLFGLFHDNQNLNQDDLDAALRHFSEAGNPDMLNFLLQHGYNGLTANPLAASDDGETALSLAEDGRNFGDEDEIAAFNECIAILTSARKEPNISRAGGFSCRSQLIKKHHSDDNNPPPSSCSCAASSGSNSCDGARGLT